MTASVKYLIASVLLAGSICLAQTNGVNSASPAFPATSTNNSSPKPQDPYISKVIELYGKKEYEEAIELLENNSAKKDENPLWYYYHALCLGRLERHEEAIQELDIYIEKVGILNSSRAFYFIGLMHFYKMSFDKASSNLEVALDLSRDKKLDKAIGALIDKNTNYKLYFETRKPTNVDLQFGYTYDSNSQNISQELSDINLAGNVFNYGLSVSHRALDKVSFVIEPFIRISDSYTFNSQFKAVPELQQNDMLQILGSLPFLFSSDKEKSPTQFELSLNAYTSFAPITSSKRDQYISSYFAKGRITHDFTEKISSQLVTIYGQDQSVNSVDENSIATGPRGDVIFSFIYNVDKEENAGLGIDLSSGNKSATGIDSRYRKSGMGLNYWFTMPSNWSSLLKLNYETISYSDRAAPRTDNKYLVDVTFARDFADEGISWLFFLGSETNSSNIDVNKYSDYKIGLAVNKRFSF